MRLSLLLASLLLWADPLHAGPRPKPPPPAGGVPPPAGEECLVDSYLLGTDTALARKCDRALVGMQHWYAKYFDGRTFRFTPTKNVGSYRDVPGGGSGFNSGAPNLRHLRVIFDPGWAKRYPEGFGGGDNARDDEGGRATFSIRYCVDPIFRHDHNFGGEERAWYVLCHELGHAFGMLHVGASGDLMQKPAKELNPYDPKRNKIIVGQTMYNQLKNKKFFRREYNPELTDAEVKEIIDGKVPDDVLRAYILGQKKGSAGGTLVDPPPAADVPATPPATAKKPPKTKPKGPKPPAKKTAPPPPAAPPPAPEPPAEE